MQDKYVGLVLAIVSTLAIGSSFVITKKGLNEAIERHGFEGDGYSYLQRPLWWIGIIVMVVGEISNFAAYAFAPAILVTPLGALSVLIGAVLGTYFLGETLGVLGKIGCAICILGSVIIVLHAPPDPEITTIDRLLDFAIQPAFMLYCIIITVFAVVMIYRIAPKYGKKNPLIYLSICSTVGSVSIMAIKAFGIAVKITLAGDNQFTHASTYVFMIVVAVCILTQMNYFNKALSQFSTNIVNPLYYVTFTTATLCASFIMFRGFNTTDAVNTISLLTGFLTIFSGVYLLNLSRKDPVGDTLLGSARPGHHGGFEEAAIPTDSLTAFGTRLSMQARRSSADGGGGSTRHSRAHSWGSNTGPGGGGGRRSIGDREALMGDFALGELAENEDDEDALDEEALAAKGLLPNGHGNHAPSARRAPSAAAHAAANAAAGNPRLSGSGRPRVDSKDPRKPPPSGKPGDK